MWNIFVKKCKLLEIQYDYHTAWKYIETATTVFGKFRGVGTFSMKRGAFGIVEIAMKTNYF